MAIPALLYESESLTMKRADFQKLQTTEMEVLRAVGDYDLLDKKWIDNEKLLIKNDMNEYNSID